MLIKRLLIIIVFTGLSVLFAHETYQLWASTENTWPSDAPPTSGPEAVGPQNSRGRVMPPTYFSIVAKKNLFSSDRTEHIAQPEPPKTKQISRPNPMLNTMALFGVILQDKQKAALVLTGKETKWVKVGDKLTTMTVDQIESDRIILSERNNSYEILLDDQSNPNKNVANTVKQESEPTIIYNGRLGSKAKGRSKAPQKPLTSRR